jgi:uncharacterized protein
MFNLILTGAIFGILYSIKAIFVVTQKRPKPWNWLLTVIYSSVTIGFFLWCYFTTQQWEELRVNNQDLLDFAVGGFFTLAVTTLIIGVIHLLDDLVYLVRWIVRKFKKRSIKPNHEEDIVPAKKMSRSSFITKVGLGVGGFILGSFAWGLTKGKFGWKIFEHEIAFDNLPPEFDGARIVQISDFHLGSFKNNFEPLEEAVQMVNDLNPDYIFFTGDLINTYATEAEAWIPVFRKLKAKKGKYSILGNHDYGYYGDTTDEEQEQIKLGVIEMNKRMDFQILVNEHAILEHKGAKIGLLGVENWGESHWFPKIGDVAKAEENMPEVPFKILLSHDPSHWDMHIQGKRPDIDLTLSGHTHGAQMGLRIPGVLEISPAALMFKRWAGLYFEGKQALHINRGLGYLMIPGRIGMPPEISLLTLKRQKA